MKILLTVFFVSFNLLAMGQVNLDSLLFACYPMSGNAGDSSGNGIHGTINGAGSTTDRFNNSNSALVFDGVDDYISYGNVLNVPSQSAITISMWFYPELITGNINRHTGIHFGSKDVGHLTLRVNQEDVMHFQAMLNDANQNNFSSIRSDSTFSYNSWYHVVGIFTNDYVKLYVNGVQQNTASNGGLGGKLTAVPSSTDMRIGKSYVWNSPVTDHFFHGKLDDVKIYTRELSYSEINALYQNQYTCIGSMPSSVQNPTSSLEINMFPNPVSDILTIQHDLEVNPGMVITNGQGQLVMEKNNVQGQSQVDLSNLPNGLYLIRLQNNKGKATKRIAVQH